MVNRLKKKQFFFLAENPNELFMVELFLNIEKDFFQIFNVEVIGLPVKV